jgi:hypothetical protein
MLAEVALASSMIVSILIRSQEYESAVLSVEKSSFENTLLYAFYEMLTGM